MDSVQSKIDFDFIRKGSNNNSNNYNNYEESKHVQLVKTTFGWLIVAFISNNGQQDWKTWFSSCGTNGKRIFDNNQQPATGNAREFPRAVVVIHFWSHVALIAWQTLGNFHTHFGIIFGQPRLKSEPNWTWARARSGVAPQATPSSIFRPITVTFHSGKVKIFWPAQTGNC